MPAPPLPTLLGEKGPPPPPPPPLGYRPNIALFSRIDTCRGFSYTVFRDCVYIHAHTHTRHTPDAVRFFLTLPRCATKLASRLRACVYTYDPDARLLVQQEGVVYLCVVGAVQAWGASGDRRVRALWVYAGLLPIGCYVFERMWVDERHQKKI